MDDRHGGAALRAPKRLGLLFLLLLLAASATDARAADAAGRVISSVGAVHATDARGDERGLERGDEVHAGDTLTLGERAHAQLRMRDDALLELEADSRFAIERYTESPGGGSVTMRLLRGAMRTITGAIGDAPDDSYRVDTPVATIGVRGTQYALHLCGAGCAGEDRDAGLYGRVDDGAIAASNEAASRVFRENDYFYVAALDTAPRAIVRPPEGILDGGAVSSGALHPAPGVGGDDGSLVEDGANETLDGATGTVDAAVDGTTELLGDTVEGTTGVVGDTVEGATDVVGDTAAGASDLASDALGGDADLGSTLEDTGDLAGDTLDSTGDLAGDTLDATGDLAGDTLDATGDLADDTLDDTTELADDTLDGTTDTLNDTLENTTDLLR